MVNDNDLLYKYRYLDRISQFLLKNQMVLLNNFIHLVMSNKNIALQKYKRPSAQQIKTSNSGIFKDHSKFTSQYSSNISKDTTKTFKPHVISRHASEQQLRRKFPIHSNSALDHNLVSAQDEFYTNLGHSKSAHDQIKIPNYSDYHNSRNYLKETSSTQSIQHNTNRRVSPGSSPAFIRSKPRLIIKEDRMKNKLSRQNFKIIKKIGQGKFGKVFMVRQITTGFIMAMKVQEKKKVINDNILEQFIRELKIQVFLNHPNIIDIYGFFHDETHFYTLQQLGADGQLYNMISQHKNLTEEATSFIIKNLLEAINCMHDKKILHRDIKPENIVLILGNVKLCDFGWAVNKIKKQELRSTFCGTPLYLSPQLLKGYKYDEKVDLWAVGILSYELLIGCSPFEINQQQDLHKILTEEVRFPKGKKVSPQFQEFIRHILNKNPKDRLPSQELLMLPFIRKYEQFETCEQLCR